MIADTSATNPAGAFFSKAVSAGFILFYLFSEKMSNLKIPAFLDAQGNVIADGMVKKTTAGRWSNYETVSASATVGNADGTESGRVIICDTDAVTVTLTDMATTVVKGQSQTFMIYIDTDDIDIVVQSSGTKTFYGLADSGTTVSSYLAATTDKAKKGNYLVVQQNSWHNGTAVEVGPWNIIDAKGSWNLA